MSFDLYSASGFPYSDAADHWIDDALRAVPLPDGFLARMNTLANELPATRTIGEARAAETRAGGRDPSDRFLATRGLAGTTRRREASNGRNRR